MQILWSKVHVEAREHPSFDVEVPVQVYAASRGDDGEFVLLMPLPASGRLVPVAAYNCFAHVAMEESYCREQCLAQRSIRLHHFLDEDEPLVQQVRRLGEENQDYRRRITELTNVRLKDLDLLREKEREIREHEELYNALVASHNDQVGMQGRKIDRLEADNARFHATIQQQSARLAGYAHPEQPQSVARDAYIQLLSETFDLAVAELRQKISLLEERCQRIFTQLRSDE